MRKKFLFSLAFFLALNFCVSALGASTPLIIGTSESLTFTYYEPEDDEDGNIQTDEYWVLEGGDYIFACVADALEFANDPDEYVSSNYGSDYSVDSSLDFSSIEITLKNAQLGGAITLSDYDSLSTVLIKGEGLTLYTDNQRDITVNTASISFTIEDLTIDGSNYSQGGIEISGTNSATFSNLTFQNITEGGAVVITGGSGIIFTNCKFLGNISDNGGAVNLSGGGVTFEACTFNKNYSENGGAMHISGFDSLTFSGSNKFTNNSADIGGGALFFASGVGTADVNSNTVFTGNKAANGGSIYIEGGTVNIYSEISSEASGNGGAIFVSSKGTANVYGTLTANSAENGGAVYVDGGTANIYGTLTANEALADGGAIFINGNGTVNIETENTIEGNISEQNGGAVYLAARNSKLNINGSSAVTFRDNHAESGGGAIYAELGTLSFTPEINFIENSTINGNGGALWLGTAQLLQSLTGTLIFESNLAQRTDDSDDTLGNGAAIYVGATTASSVTLSSSHNYTFKNNVADCYGGAIYTLSPDITFDGVTFSDKNRANVGGGFAASASGRISITNSSTISNQEAPKGGAIYGINITVSSSDLTSNKSTGSSSTYGGGAIFATGQLTLEGAKFEDNEAEQNGGAILVVCEDDDRGAIVIKDSYFEKNVAKSGNGGAVNLQTISSLSVTTSTFMNNESRTAEGGAMYVEGYRPDISYCYLSGNYARNRGGAVYFDQVSFNDEPDTVFKISYSMIQKNSASGEQGGGLFIKANGATIDSCTFDGNELNITDGTGYGGGLYLDTVDNETKHNTIENCTFTNNSMTGGNSGTSGGGAIAIYCERTTMRSCTFTDNNSAYKGGAIYIAEGLLSISGTIAVGNTMVGDCDIWSDAEIESNGYNRIGIYANRSGVTDFYSATRNDTDRTGYPRKGWTRETFFTSSVLADNERSDLGDDIPPYIGSERAGQLRLQTLMLSEDLTLPAIDRATNIIPYSARQRFPEKDERGVNRRGSGSREIKMDIGAVFFDGTRETDEESETASYTIRAIQISGLPNSIRQPGTSIKLSAKIYYTNGRTAKGTTFKASTDEEKKLQEERNEEPVEWSVTGVGAGYVKIDKYTGVLTVTNVATRPIIAVITVATERLDNSGEVAAKDSKYVVIGGYEGGNMNSAPGYNTNNDYLMRELIYDFEEYNVGYGFFNDANLALQSQTIQNLMTEIYGLNSASLITDLSASTLDLISPSVYNPSEGFAPLIDTGVTIELQNVSEGEVLPVPYPCNLSGNTLREILGSDVYNSLTSDLFVASQNDSTVSDETAQKIFSHLRVDFEDKKGNVWPLIGAGSNTDLIQALDCGALVLSSDNDYSGGIHFTLNTCIINAEAQAPESYGAQLIGDEGEELLMISDGVNDSEIYGTIWVSQKESQSSTNSSTTSKSENQNNSGSENSSGSSSSSKSESESGSGGGGCEVFSLGLIAAGLILILKKK